MRRGRDASQWVPAHGEGTAVLHLAPGLISVIAGRIHTLVKG
jgi:hypothetical protein